MYVELPLAWGIEDEVIYRLNVWAIALQLGLDVERLNDFRLAVEAGIYSDEAESQA